MPESVSAEAKMASEKAVAKVKIDLKSTKIGQNKKSVDFSTSAPETNNNLIDSLPTPTTKENSAGSTKDLSQVSFLVGRV